MLVIMVMLVIMSMMMTTSAACTMRVVMIVMLVVMVVIMIMTMRMSVVIISTALGLEGTHDRCHRTTQTPHHFGKNMILFDIDRFRRDLTRSMAIADMPSRLEQARGIVRTNFDKGLRSRFHENQRPVFKFERIAIIERSGFFKIEQEGGTLLACEGHTMAISPFMVKTD